MAAWFAAFIRGGDDDIAKRRRITANLSLSFQRQPGDSCTRFTRANDFSCFASHREKPKPKKGNSRLFQASVSLFFFFFFSLRFFLHRFVDPFEDRSWSRISFLKFPFHRAWYIFFWISVSTFSSRVKIE